MKNVKMNVSAIVLALMLGFFGFNANAQKNANGRGNGNCNGQGRMMTFLNLTQSQQDQMDILRTKHLQETQQVRNQLNEKRAHLQTLRTAKNVDMKAVNANLKEISGLKLKIAEMREVHIQDVRKILNDDQRAKFDAHKPMARGSRGYGNGYGNGNGNGSGMNGKGGRPCGR